jgi:hypothetical protein
MSWRPWGRSNPCGNGGSLIVEYNAAGVVQRASLRRID